MRLIVFLAALICFASFGWAMLHHFERPGKPKPGMVLVAAVVPVFATLHFVGLAIQPLALPMFALIIYMSAIALFWSAVAVTRGRGLTACFQRQVPTALVRSGPYRTVRHPFYTAYTFVWLGGFTATGWWPLAITAIVMATLYAYAARIEETDFFRSTLRSEYEVYMRRTGSFLPRIDRSH